MSSEETTAFTDSAGEPLTGVREREAFLGFERRESTAPAPEPKKIYDGPDATKEAAADLTEARRAAGGESNEPDVIHYLDGERKSLTVEQAAHDLSQYHAEQRAKAELDDLTTLQSGVDAARAWVYGSQQPQQSEQQQAASPEAPQPESPPVDESGVDPDIVRALENPKLRDAIEAYANQTAEAEKAYRDGLANNAAVTLSYAFSQFPEFSGLSFQQATQQLAILDRQNPQRAYEIRTQLQAPAQMLAEAQRMAQADQARQQQVHPSSGRNTPRPRTRNSQSRSNGMALRRWQRCKRKSSNS
jgi:hypothetical protein